MRRLSSTERKVIFLSTLGGALEFYDFIIYVFLAHVLGFLFFPNGDPLTSLMEVFAVFAVGYLVRPLGGILFSHFGDKYGRKKTFTLTLLLMALPTFAVGLLPTHADVGIWATVLLVSLRLLQGLAVGGEIPGSVVFVGEHAQAGNRGFTCGVIFFGINFGLMLGSAVVVLLNHFFTSEQLILGAWRLAFLLGGVLGLISFYLRKKLTETPIFAQHLQEVQATTIPLLQACRFYPKALLRGMAISSLAAVIISLLFLFTTTYFSSIFHYPAPLVDKLNTANILFFSVVMVVTGWLSDRWGRKLLLRIGSIGLFISAYALYALATQMVVEHLIYALIAFAILSACIQGAFACTLIELFPTEIRYTGTAVSYDLSFALFGGLTPLLVTYLIKITGDNLAPAYYLMICAVFCFLATLGLKDRHQEPLT